MRKSGNPVAGHPSGLDPVRLSGLLGLLDEAYDRKAWHGANLRGSVRRLTAGEASWRPEPGRHNVWELVVHAAYWKYMVRRRITGEKGRSFPLSGSDWFPRPLAGRSWPEDLALLEDEHRKLRSAVAQWVPPHPARGESSSPSSRRTRGAPESPAERVMREVSGAALHDVYHSGQIRLLLALRGGK